jgi:hypothetical protein
MRRKLQSLFFPSDIPKNRVNIRNKKKSVDYSYGYMTPIILIAVKICTMVFWIMTPCGLAAGYWHFGRIHWRQYVKKFLAFAWIVWREAWKTLFREASNLIEIRIAYFWDTSLDHYL